MILVSTPGLARDCSLLVSMYMPLTLAEFVKIRKEKLADIERKLGFRPGAFVRLSEDLDKRAIEERLKEEIEQRRGGPVRRLIERFEEGKV